MAIRSSRVGALALLALGPWAGTTVTPASASAQIRASERASVSQTVDGTVMSVDYARPRARGREELFGGVVEWGEVWTPGANDATVLELNRDVTIEGTSVPAGRWSVWMVVDPGGTWELVLDPRDDLFHTAHPGPTEEQIRFPVEVEEGEHVEALTWSFPLYRADQTTLVLAWGTTRIPFEIEVESTAGDVTISAEAAAPYVGSWRQSMTAGPGGAPAGEPTPMEIRLDGDRLVAATRFGPPGAGEPVQLLLMPRAEGIFGIGFMEDGMLLDAPPGILLEFELDDAGRAVAATLRGPDDEVLMEAERAR